MKKNKKEFEVMLDECGAAEIPVEEALIIAGCSRELWDKSQALRDAYRAGQLRTKLAVRKAVVAAAIDGDPQAVKIYFTFVNAVEKAEKPEGGEIVL